MLRKATFVVICAAAVAWWLMARPAATTESAPQPRTGQKTDALGMRDMLRIDPRAGSFGNAGGKLAVKLVSANVQAYRDRRDFASLYKELKAGEQNGESLWLQAKILAECAKRPKEPTKEKSFKLMSPEEDRERFFSRLLPNDPNRAKRIAAYETLSRGPCGDLKEMTKTQDEIYELVKTAAAAGDVRARAELLNEEASRLMKEARDKGLAIPKFEISDDQLQAIKGMLALKDADIVRIVSGQISGSDSGVLVMNDSGDPLNPRAIWQAWELVACELGANCGASSPIVLSACAWLGECETDNLVDYTFFYSASIYHGQLINQYRQSILEMMRTGDFSRMRIVRNPVSPKK